MPHHFSQEIQGLRAVAVISVIIYHIWPTALSGGYVGVDVFFVISGYLITRLLVSELQSNNKLSLTGFYARRINRLLPAASFVIVTCLCFYWLLPPLEWANTAVQAVASAIYLQNWLLAFQATDYLEVENGVRVFKHFWSLSVEEQFYIFWPLVILSSYHLARVLNGKTGLSSARLINISLWFLCLAGLAYSVLVTSTNPAWAYFSTLTRAWEFCLGGCLVSLTRLRSTKMRELANVLGLLAIAVACITFSGQTLFPGYMALLPTLGAALVIYSIQGESRVATSAVLRLRFMQTLGGVSYSLYLWHWPLTVYLKNILPATNYFLVGSLVILSSFGAALLSKRFIEDRFRGESKKGAIKFLIVSVLLPLLLLVLIKYHLDSDYVKYANSNGRLSGLSSTPFEARKDFPEVYKLGCHTDLESATLNPCTFGSSSNGVSIAIIGDSHAAQWVPALREISQEKELELVSYTKSACNVSNNSVMLKGVRYERCEQWRDTLIETLIKTKPTLVLMTQVRTYKVFGAPVDYDRASVLAQGIAETVKLLAKHNIRTALVLDTARLKKDIPVCLSRLSGSYSECDSAKQSIVDPIKIAAERNQLSAIDMNRYICPDELCKAISGAHIVWQDRHHLTARFARSMSESLWKELVALEPGLAASVGQKD